MAGQMPQEQPAQQPRPSDPLVNLIEDVQKERQRIRSIQDPSLAQLKSEVAGTTLDLLEDALKMLLGVRNHMLAMQTWASGEFNKFAEVEQSHEDRLEILETYGGDTQILPDHAQLLLDVVEGCGFVVQKLVEGPFPIETPDEEALQALATLQEKCETAKMLVEGAVMDTEEAEEEEEEEPGGIQLPTMSSVQQQQDTN